MLYAALNASTERNTVEQEEKADQEVKSVFDHYESREVQRSRQVVDHYETYYTYEDNGEGGFIEVAHERPVYRTEYYTETVQEPVYVYVSVPKSELPDDMDEIILSAETKDTDLNSIRAMIIREISASLAAANMKATVDPNTGDIVLDSSVFFETGKSAIKEEGQELLSRFIPVYLDVLLRDKYADYLGEIIIEGHTDSSGSYETNLKLSQDRALQVALYCLSMPSLTRTQKLKLQQILTAKGRSYSDLVYGPDGLEDPDASRRVEFKFSLKDAEMIEELNRLLSEQEAAP